MEDSAMRFQKPPKKQWLDTDKNKCVICQKLLGKNDKLTNSKLCGIAYLVNAAKIRNDDTYQYLKELS